MSTAEKCPKIDLRRTGKNIKRIMVFRGMTVRNVQEYLGLAAPQSIYHWFDGSCLPTLDNLYALSELFGVPMDMLIRGDRDERCAHMDRLRFTRIIQYYEYLRAV